MGYLKHLMLAFMLAVGVMTTAVAAEKLDINSATATQLASALDGIGEKKARAIVAYRQANGEFTELDQLQNVKGIGEATVNRLRGQLTLGKPKVAN